MFLEHALLYESYALYLCAEGKLQEADKVYAIGISRLVFHSKFTSEEIQYNQMFSCRCDGKLSFVA